MVKEVTAADGLRGDLHEFKITSAGTGLLTSYVQTPANLSHFGIHTQGWIYDSTFQEIDIATGSLLFEWRASDHYNFNETYVTPSSLKISAKQPSTAFDWFHINSIDKDETNGNYYISSRYLHTISCIHGKSGEVLWTLGGKRNEFTDVSSIDRTATNIAWNHHVVYLGNDTLTVFDNAKVKGMTRNEPAESPYSRGILAKLDPANKTVELLEEFSHPRGWAAQSQGSVQILSSGNVLVGWGYIPGYTEFNPAGEVLCDVQLAPSVVSTLGWVKNYRTAQSNAWVGKPRTRPAVKIIRSFFAWGEMGNLYVSWNGATEVRGWLLQGFDAPFDARSETAFEDVEEIERNGFEDAIELDNLECEVPQYVRVAALDSDGHVLGVSDIVDRATEATVAVHWTFTAVALFASCFVMYKVWKRRQSLRRIVIRRTSYVRKVLRRTAFGRRLLGSHEMEEDDVEYQMLYHDEDVPGMDLNEVYSEERGKQH